MAQKATVAESFFIPETMSAELQQPYSHALLQKLELEHMFHIANEMINENVVALMTPDPENTRSRLELASVVRRLERVDDYNTNIAGEVIFCFEVLVLKNKNTGTSQD